MCRSKSDCEKTDWSQCERRTFFWLPVMAVTSSRSRGDEQCVCDPSLAEKSNCLWLRELLTAAVCDKKKPSTTVKHTEKMPFVSFLCNEWLLFLNSLYSIISYVCLKVSFVWRVKYTKRLQVDEISADHRHLWGYHVRIFKEACWHFPDIFYDNQNYGNFSWEAWTVLFYFVVLSSCVMFCFSLPSFVLFPPFPLFY